LKFKGTKRKDKGGLTGGERKNLEQESQPREITEESITQEPGGDHKNEITCKFRRIMQVPRNRVGKEIPGREMETKVQLARGERKGSIALRKKQKTAGRHK